MSNCDQLILLVRRVLNTEFRAAAELTGRSEGQILREFMYLFVNQHKLSAAAASPSTAEERQAAMKFGASSVALEGFTISSEAQAQQQRWVRGEITIEECIAGIKQIHRSP